MMQAAGKQWTQDEIREQAERLIEQEQAEYCHDAEPEPGAGQDKAPGAGGRFPSQFVMKCLSGNQKGDAELFQAIHLGRYLYDHSAGAWLKWAGHYWKQDKQEAAVADVQAVCEVYETEAQRISWQLNQAKTKEETEHLKSSEKALRKRKFDLQGKSRIKDVLELARAGDTEMSTAGDSWDLNPMLIACQNAVIDLTTGESRAGLPMDMMKTACPVVWKGKNEPAPTWEQRFLPEIFDGNQELISFMQRLSGYCLTGKTNEEVFPILLGSGRNGKTKYVEAVKGYMGDYAGTIEIESLIEQKNSSAAGGPRADKMSLRGKRFIAASESEDGHRLSTSTIKSLTGGDSISARAPFGRYQVDFPPTHKMVLLSNFEPKIHSDDPAIWARVLKIPFNMRFVDDPKEANERLKDRHLSEKLQAEYSGILAWAVRGCLEWQKIGLQPPDIVRAATDAYRAKNDMLADFIETCCQGKGEVQAKVIFDAYSAYCSESGINPLSMNKFTDQMITKFDRYAKNRKKYYIGISLLNE